MDNSMFNYENIRPYKDDEMQPAFRELIQDPEFLTVAGYVFPGKSKDEVTELLLSLKSIFEFQSRIVGPFFFRLTQKTSDGLDISGLERIDKNKKYLFISNHRDIVLDAALLNTLMIINGFDTSENAIGDNLFINRWITAGMRLNKNFIVKRSGTKRELFEASKLLSNYIRENIRDNHNSIWLAQREGRSKNSDDRTQESLLKMLNMSADKSPKEGFLELNIVPISISYEFDACDFLKAKEFQQKRDNPDFKKTKEDDFLNIKTGLTGYKGKIHYEVTGGINDELKMQLHKSDDREQTLKKVADIIDCRIHENYRIYSGNYVALDILNRQEQYLDKEYTKEQKERFSKYAAGQIEKIDLPNKNIDFLYAKLIEMYANPLINHLKANEKCNTSS